MRFGIWALVHGSRGALQDPEEPYDASWERNRDLVLDTLSFYRPTQPGSYPIVLATYEIVCSKYPAADVGTAVKAFLQSTIAGGQNGLGDNGYVPIPDSFKSRLSTAVNAIS